MEPGIIQRKLVECNHNVLISTTRLFSASFASFLCVLCGSRFFGGPGRGQPFNRKGRKECQEPGHL